MTRAHNCVTCRRLRWWRLPMFRSSSAAGRLSSVDISQNSSPYFHTLSSDTYPMELWFLCQVFLVATTNWRRPKNGTSETNDDQINERAVFLIHEKCVFINYIPNVRIHSRHMSHTSHPLLHHSLPIFCSLQLVYVRDRHSIHCSYRNISVH